MLKSAENVMQKIENPEDFYIVSYSSDQTVAYLLECSDEDEAFEIMRKNANSLDDVIDYTNVGEQTTEAIGAIPEEHIHGIRAVNEFLKKYGVEEYEDINSYIDHIEIYDYLVVDTETGDVYLVEHGDIMAEPLYYLGDYINAYGFDEQREVRFVVQDIVIEFINTVG